MKTVVHITDQATRKMGGIGTALEGLHSCSAYNSAVDRSILLGPLLSPHNSFEDILAAGDDILYSSRHGIFEHPYTQKLSEIEHKFGVYVIYGTRSFPAASSHSNKSAEVILIDVSQASVHPVNALKAWLFDEFSLPSDHYENQPEFELYAKLAPAALAVLRAMDASNPNQPTVVIAHGYKGIPTALAAVMDPLGAFKTIFHAHEATSVRRIVEEYPGHDTMFYNALQWSQQNNYYLNEMFGPQDFFFKHALVNASRFCDNIMAVSNRTAQELRFLGPQFDNINIDLAYNGLTTGPTTLADKKASKAKLQQYTQNILGYFPDYVFTHAAKMSLSEAFWRDLRVLYHLEEQFRRENRTAVFFLLGTDSPVRSSRDIHNIEQDWQWPATHRTPGLDLTQAEASFYTNIQEFNSRNRHIKAVYINQFGWDYLFCGNRMPSDMQFMDFRRGSDLEFGQSTYEPFGSAPLEALSQGSLCVVSSISGCLDAVRDITGSPLPSNVIVADYTRLDNSNYDRQSILAIDQHQRDRIEDIVSGEMSHAILEQLPQNDAQTEKLIEQGYDIAQRMNWDVVCDKYFLPALSRAYHKQRSRRIA